MHEKCVKYQDLVFGLFQVLLTLLTSNSLISYSQMHQIRVLSQVEDMKLTMNTVQIENLLKILDSFDFP